MARLRLSTPACTAAIARRTAGGSRRARLCLTLLKLCWWAGERASRLLNYRLVCIHWLMRRRCAVDDLVAALLCLTAPPSLCLVHLPTGPTLVPASSWRQRWLQRRRPAQRRPVRWAHHRCATSLTCWAARKLPTSPGLSLVHSILVACAVGSSLLQPHPSPSHACLPCPAPPRTALHQWPPLCGPHRLLCRLQVLPPAGNRRRGGAGAGGPCAACRHCLVHCAF